MKKVLSIFVILLLTAQTAFASNGLLGGLLGGRNTRTSRPVTNSFGNSDLAKYKTFTIANIYPPNSPESLKVVPIMQGMATRFYQEGFKFINKLDDADFVITMMFIDAVGQDYVPPRTYTSVNYDPGTTQTSGTITGMGNFITYNANSTSNATMSATTTTSGGYFVPNYGIAMAMNIYDTKTKSLVFSGSGACRAEMNNIYSAADDIILAIIDNHLVTPAYLAKERDKVRGRKGLTKENEYLMPVVPNEKLGFYQGTYKDNVDGFGIILGVMTQGQTLSMSTSIKNNTQQDFEFDPAKVQAMLQGEPLKVLAKSDVVSAYFQSVGVNSGNSSLSIQENGLAGVVLGSVFQGISGIFGGNRNPQEARDKAVKFIYDNYMEKHIIKSGESYQGSLYIVGPLILNEDEKVKISIPLPSKNGEVEFRYKQGWLTQNAYARKYSKK